MSKPLRLLLLILSGLIGLAVVAMASGQVGQTIVLQCYGRPCNPCPLSMLILGSAAMGGFAMHLWGVVRRANLQEQLKRFELNKDKAVVFAETSEDRVKALEQKIATLETALSKALGTDK